jgi:thymidylate synthase
VIADCHIYDRHIPLVERMLRQTPFDAPVFEMDRSITDFYRFSADSFCLQNYRFHEFPDAIPVAL